jgi:hypothetical protein
MENEKRLDAALPRTDLAKAAARSSDADEGGAEQWLHGRLLRRGVRGRLVVVPVRRLLALAGLVWFQSSDDG